MSIDLARELTVRSIAHNIALKYGSYDPANDDTPHAEYYAGRLAELLTADPEPFVEAAVALWRATSSPAPIHATMSGLQPEEGTVHD